MLRTRYVHYTVRYFDIYIYQYIYIYIQEVKPRNFLTGLLAEQS